jgi:hypothetical protein
MFWANGTSAKQPSAVYKFDIPNDVTSSKQIKAPTLVAATPPDAIFLDFVSGGFTNGMLLCFFWGSIHRCSI